MNFCLILCFLHTAVKYDLTFLTDLLFFSELINPTAIGN